MKLAPNIGQSNFWCQSSNAPHPISCLNDCSEPLRQGCQFHVNVFRSWHPQYSRTLAVCSMVFSPVKSSCPWQLSKALAGRECCPCKCSVFMSPGPPLAKSNIDSMRKSKGGNLIFLEEDLSPKAVRSYWLMWGSSEWKLELSSKRVLFHCHVF